MGFVVALNSFVDFAFCSASFVADRWLVAGDCFEGASSSGTWLVAASHCSL